MQQYFIAASVTNEAKQRAILLSACDARTYRLIRSLSAPNDPKDTSLSDLIKLMSEHYQPKPSVTVQRFKFHSHFHKCGESVATCVAEPKKNSEHCDYGDKLIEMIRDQLVCGINDSHIQRRLLAEPDLTYKKAFDLAQATIDLQGSKQHRNPIDLHYTAVKKSATVVEEVTRLQNVNTKMLFASPVGKKDTWQKSVEAKSRTQRNHKLFSNTQRSLRKPTIWMRGRMMMSTTCLLLTQPPINPWHSLLL